MPRGDGTGPRGRGPNYGQGRGQGRFAGQQGRGRIGETSSIPAGECVCPECGTKTPHQLGMPCIHQQCPRCGSMMMRNL